VNNQYLQNTGVTSTNTVRISSLPSSIPTVKSHFAASGNDEKLPAGPMIVPSPGPTLHTAVVAPLNAVVQSSPMRLRPKAIAAIVMEKKNEKVKKRTQDLFVNRVAVVLFLNHGARMDQLLQTAHQ